MSFFLFELINFFGQCLSCHWFIRSFVRPSIDWSLSSCFAADIANQVNQPVENLLIVHLGRVCYHFLFFARLMLTHYRSTCVLLSFSCMYACKIDKVTDWSFAFIRILSETYIICVYAPIIYSIASES